MLNSIYILSSKHLSKKKKKIKGLGIYDSKYVKCIKLSSAGG